MWYGGIFLKFLSQRTPISMLYCLVYASIQISRRGDKWRISRIPTPRQVLALVRDVTNGVYTALNREYNKLISYAACICMILIDDSALMIAHRRHFEDVAWVVGRFLPIKIFLRFIHIYQHSNQINWTHEHTYIVYWNHRHIIEVISHWLKH